LSPGRIKGALIREWSGPNLPKGARFGLCILCGMLTRTPKFHRPCNLKWHGTLAGRTFKSLRRRKLEASLAPTRPGAPITEESLKTSYSWAIQHHLARKSFRQIGNENGLTHSDVDARIRSLINKLDPDLLKPLFQRAARLLLDASRKSPSHLNG